VSRASGITQQLLAFAQADYRSSDLSDLTETFLIFFDDVEPSLAQRGIRLRVDWIDSKIPCTAVLRDPLRIALGNIVSNAVEAMPGGGTLSVKLARRDADSALITILDSGGGLNEADMEHLFEPFHTTKGVRGSGEARSAGLGLAVAHGLVAEMNGSITAVNVPGEGARFDIVLPVRTQSSSDERR
jgi:signal transduction histidine kinase